MTEIQYSNELETLLKENGEESESYAILHRLSYERFNNFSNLINLPVIVLSSAIGFAQGVQIDYKDINIILGCVSIFIGVVKSIDSYFAFGRRCESHRICSLQFAQIQKKIQVELSLKREERIGAKEMLNEIKINIKNLHDIAPLIPKAIINMYNKKYGHNNSVSKPNIVNGLTNIKILGSQLSVSADIVSVPIPPNPPNLMANNYDEDDGAM